MAYDADRMYDTGGPDLSAYYASLAATPRPPAGASDLEQFRWQATQVDTPWNQGAQAEAQKMVSEMEKYGVTSVRGLPYAKDPSALSNFVKRYTPILAKTVIGLAAGGALSAGAGGTGAATSAGGAGASAGAGAGVGEAVSGFYGAGAGELAGAAASYGGAAGGLAGAGGGGTALSRIFDGSGSSADYLSVLGGLGQAAYGAYASDKQTDAYKGLAEKYMAMGEPYRGKLAEISADPNQFYNSPGAQQAMRSYNQSISKDVGNPAGSPYGQALGIEALYKQYGAERDRLASFGGLQSFNSAAPGAAGNVIASQGNTYNAVGAGLGSIFNPPQKQMTLAEMLRGSGQYY